jgi:hypothetical protein
LHPSEEANYQWNNKDEDDTMDIFEGEDHGDKILGAAPSTFKILTPTPEWTKPTLTTE